MDARPPDGKEADLNQLPKDRKAAWNWRATGLFYPETEDWALNLPPETRSINPPEAGLALHESASGSPD